MKHLIQIQSRNSTGDGSLAPRSVGGGSFWVLLITTFVLMFAGLGIAQAATITVNNESELRAAVGVANNSGGNTTILISDGVYTLSDTLYINTPNVSLSGKTGNRANVIIQGDAMSGNANVGNLLRVAGSGFKLNGLTLRRSGWHLIQIVGESNADSPEITNCIMQDAYEQMIKVSFDAGQVNNTSDNGRVENCLFEYTAGIGPQYYIGGIDAHGAKNWIIRNNTFRNIISPNTSVAEYAVHFWNTSANNLVEKNLIVNCDRGIGFGLGDRSNSGGIIRNNMIFHAANKGAFADVGIALQNSSGTSVYNNTIYMQHSYPAAIEYRFSGTTNTIIENNLVNKGISRLDGASGSLSNNVTGASANWFVDASSGDLHLASQVPAVIDQGKTVSGLTDDFDGDARPIGSGIDIGADEYSVGIRPRAPTNLRVD